MIASRQNKRNLTDTIMPLTLLFDYLEMLSALIKDKDSVKVPARHERTIKVARGFDDTSGRCLGRTSQTGKDGKISTRIVVWSSHEEEEFSLNWK